MVRRARLIAVVGVYVIGSAVLQGVGCAGVRSEAPEEEQGRTEATGEEQGRSPEAASEEDRCEGTRTIDLAKSASAASASAALFVTNDLPGCPNKGGLLSGTSSTVRPARMKCAALVVQTTSLEV